MTTFRRTGPLPALPKGWPVLSLDEQIQQVNRLSQIEEARLRFKPAHSAGVPRELRPGAVTADEILRAFRKANGEDDDDDKPKDDDPELRGPDQTRIVATADGIIRAMKKAAGEL